MKITICENPASLGKAAGLMAAQMIDHAIRKKGQATIVLATGTSQFATLTELTSQPLDWGDVIMYHLDEYIGLPESSSASFRKYIQERFIQRVSPLKHVYLISGEQDPAGECRRLGEKIKQDGIDVALVGIGENGHLGFNDPPADFDTDEPFIEVSLDEKCRKQQFGEGWFKSFDEVPRQAITMSIRQIMRSMQVVCSVPDSRKAGAITDCFDNPVSNLFPASILQRHHDCNCFLDKSSAALLKGLKNYQ